MPPGLPGLPSSGTLLRELDHHFGNVQDLYERVIHSHRPETFGMHYGSALYGPLPYEASEVQQTASPVEAPPRAGISKRQHEPVSRAACAYVLVWINGRIIRSQDSLESFLEKVVANWEWLTLLDTNAEAARCVIDLFEHSQYWRSTRAASGAVG